jgi:hypothetical protein
MIEESQSREILYDLSRCSVAEAENIFTIDNLYILKIIINNNNNN